MQKVVIVYPIKLPSKWRMDVTQLIFMRLGNSRSQDMPRLFRNIPLMSCLRTMPFPFNKNYWR